MFSRINNHHNNKNRNIMDDRLYPVCELTAEQKRLLTS
nr:MAG TPA: hypothetical protein [Caudoviricetes sp.]